MSNTPPTGPSAPKDDVDDALGFADHIENFNVRNDSEKYLVVLARAVRGLQAELKGCHGERYAADPDKWSHASQIEGLKHHLAEAEAERDRLRAELENERAESKVWYQNFKQAEEECERLSKLVDQLLTDSSYEGGVQFWIRKHNEVALEIVACLSREKQARDALAAIARRVPIMGSTGDYREGQLHALEACREVARKALDAVGGTTEPGPQP